VSLKRLDGLTCGTFCWLDSALAFSVLGWRTCIDLMDENWDFELGLERLVSETCGMSWELGFL